MPHHVYFHSEDLDGWLTEPNHPIPATVVEFLASIHGLRREDGEGTHEIQVVLNSGKPAEYLVEQAARFGGHWAISGNGVGWQRIGGALERMLPPTQDWPRFRTALGLTPDEVDVVTVRLSGSSYQLALEAKRDALGDLAISFFPEPGPVAHRWRFGPGLDRHHLAEELRALIQLHGLALHVPPPHGDGAVDVLPLVTSADPEPQPAGKWLLPQIARRIYPEAILHLTHAGDGLNDLGAMRAPGVLPMTSAECPQCVEVVRGKEGVVALRPAPGLAVVECYLRLAERGWYGPLSGTVQERCHAALMHPR